MFVTSYSSGQMGYHATLHMAIESHGSDNPWHLHCGQALSRTEAVSLTKRIPLLPVLPSAVYHCQFRRFAWDLSIRIILVLSGFIYPADIVGHLRQFHQRQKGSFLQAWTCTDHGEPTFKRNSHSGNASTTRANPPSQNYPTIVCLVLAVVISALFVAVRLYTRQRATRKLWWDDCNALEDALTVTLVLKPL